MNPEDNPPDPTPTPAEEPLPPSPPQETTPVVLDPEASTMSPLPDATATLGQNPTCYQIETAPPHQGADPSGSKRSGRRRHQDAEENVNVANIPPPAIVPTQQTQQQPDTRSKFRKSSGPGLGVPGSGSGGQQGERPDRTHSHSQSHIRKSSEIIQIHPHPSREGSIASSRRSYSRGAFFGEIPENVESYPAAASIPVRRLSTGSYGSDDGVPGVGFTGYDHDGEDQGLGASSAECESEIEALLGGSKSYMSRISISMNKSVNPVTGQTLFWGFSKQQWFLLFIFSIADLLAGIVYSLQAPFYPEEAESKGAKPTEYGLVFGVFELAMFIVSPIYGKYMSRLGPRNVFNFGIFVTGTCCILFGFLDRIQDKWTFICLSFAIRTVEAIGNAGFATATFTLIAIEFPGSVASTFASLETFFGVGLIVGPTLGGGLYQLGGYTLPFVVTGGLIFTTALLIAIFMPKSAPIEYGTGGADANKHTAGYGILTILKIPGVLLATLAIITGAISLGYLSSSLEPHIRQFNLSPLTTGLVFVINGGVYALTAPGWGWLCDRVQQTKYITLVGAIFLTLGFLLIGPAPVPNTETILWVTCVGLFIQGLGVGATFVSSFILALRHSVASGLPDNVATYSVVSGLWSSVLALGLFVGPSVAGVLYDTVGFRWGSMFVVVDGLILIFLIILFLLCNGKGEQAYFRALSARSSSSSSESDPLMIKEEDENVPDAIFEVENENAINTAFMGSSGSQGRRQPANYGATSATT